jgi:LAO/AO transport system kinase
VGQDEIDVVRMAAVVSVVLTPSSGDDVQMIKAGIMEIADVFVINKADQAGVDRLQQQLEAMLAMAPRGAELPPIVRTVATENRGIDEWVAALRSRPKRAEDAAEHWKERLLELMRQRFVERVMQKALSEEELCAAAREVAGLRRNPYEFVSEILKRVGIE